MNERAANSRRRTRPAGWIAAMTFCLAAGAGWAAEEPGASVVGGARTQVVVAGPQYKASRLHRLVFGSGYRKLWTTPIEVEVLNLGAFSGGLVPEKKGGGKQTKGLRFKAGDGRKWKFRSVDKDPTAILSKTLERTFVDSIVQDQISASFPGNATAVDALTEAAGILHVKRSLVVLPDDPRLGEFRKEFAGMLGTIEEAPSVESPVTAGFGGFTRLVDMDELEKLLDADPGERIDSRAFLRARLFDALIGDYDRHRGQWEWARDGGTGRWVPVPRDRDLAFVKFDGLALEIAKLEQPRLVDFEAEYPSVVGLTWQARFLDRRHLADLEWPVWQEVAEELKGRLTDPVIDDALRRLPPPYYRQEGPALAARLRARREGLGGFTRRFYEQLAREAEVRATDESDTVHVSRMADGSVNVLASGSGPYFRRTFLASETSEVRIFLKGGDDRAVSEGPGKPGVKVRLVGGEGNDVLDDSAGGHTRFYDSSGENRVIEGPGTKRDDRPYTPPLDRHGLPMRDWGAKTRVLPWVRGGGGYGLVLGIGFDRIGYGFRKHPYGHQHSLRVGYSTYRQTGGVQYDYQSLRTDNRSRFEVAAEASALRLIHFYGFGNETMHPGPRSFYDVNQTRYSLAPSYRLDLTALDVSLGPVVKYIDTSGPASSLIGFQRPYGFDRFGQLGTRLSFTVDRRAGKLASTSGSLLAAEGTFYPPLWNVEEAFGEVHGEAAIAASAPLPLKPTLALRVGGQKLFGRHPYHEAAYIGGMETIRGLPRQRYAGDASLYGNGELRLLLLRRDDGFVSQFGVFGLADVGRVYLKGESSDRLHTSVGGGVWLSLVEPVKTVSFTIASSEGHVRVYLQGGLMF